MHSFVHSLWLSNFKFNRWLGLFSSSHLHFFHWVRRSFPMYLMRIGWLYSANGDLLQRRHCFYKALTWCGRWHRRHQRGWSLELKRSIVSCYFFYVISTQKLFWKVTLFFSCYSLDPQRSWRLRTGATLTLWTFSWKLGLTRTLKMRFESHSCISLSPEFLNTDGEWGCRCLQFVCLIHLYSFTFWPGQY